MVQWLRLHAPNTGCPSLSLLGGLAPHAATKTSHSQINKYLKRERDGFRALLSILDATKAINMPNSFTASFSFCDSPLYFPPRVRILHFNLASFWVIMPHPGFFFAIFPACVFHSLHPSYLCRSGE